MLYLKKFCELSVLIGDLCFDCVLFESVFEFWLFVFGRLYFGKETVESPGWRPKSSSCGHLDEVKKLNVSLIQN